MNCCGSRGHRRSIGLFVVLAACALVQAQEVDPRLFSGMQYREIGPYRGGRSTACSGVVGRPDEFYMGATGGGVWKTTNAGVDWTNVSDGFFKTGSVGAIAVSESHPDVVYVGMGETQIRGNISHGDGIYKSTDAGKTWKHIGLRDTKYISRVRIHPSNPDIVWVAALGPVYAASEERGLFKSTDGGQTWRKVLYVSDRAGAVDLSIEPGNPDVMYASTWEAWRTPFSLNSGGPGSKMFKSLDGGETWTEISRNKGLPEGTLGKIGISVSPADPNRVYAIVEALDGGIFKSDDKGATWAKTNDDRGWRQRAWYYTRIYADTKAVDTVYVLNVSFGKSTDAGKTFSNVRVPHSDNHDLWIDPADPLLMVNSNDGGTNVSKDGGRTWTDQDFATAQFYHVATDNAFPYRIYGAQQDNSTVRIASRTQGGGIGTDAWESTAGGESGYVSPKPDDPEVVFGGSYGGYLERLDHRTGQSRNVNIWPDQPMGHGAIDLTERFQWTFPIVFSPHDPNLLYACSQHVWKTTNGGQSWKRISPDLTRNDPATMGPSGGPITKDNTSVEYYGTVFTLAESPLAPGTTWAGSDDGLVHVTRDAGASWTAVTPRGMPKWGLCSMIDASRHSAGTAFLAVDNHENGDHAPYIYRTSNFGRSWMLATKGIDPEAFVRVVREDPTCPGLLYAGTELGMYVSFDAGENWQPLQLNLPVVPIHDLTIKQDDLILATHGRSFWVLDDVTPLRELARGRRGDVIFFAPKDAYRVRWGGGFGGGQSGAPVGRNSLSGVVLSYYLAKDAQKVEFEFIDETGEVFFNLRGSNVPAKAGFNRTSAFPAYSSYRGFPGMILWGGGGGQITAPPGTYTVRMIVDGQSMSHQYRWLRDPRGNGSDSDLKAQFEFSRDISAAVTAANDAVVQIRYVRSQLEKAGAAHKSLSQMAKRIGSALTKVEEALYQTQNRSGQDPLNYPVRLNNRLASLLGDVRSGNDRPTDQSYEIFAVLKSALENLQKELSNLFGPALERFNARLKAAGGEEIKVPEAGWREPAAARPAG